MSAPAMERIESLSSNTVEKIQQRFVIPTVA